MDRIKQKTGDITKGDLTTKGKECPAYADNGIGTVGYQTGGRIDKGTIELRMLAGMI